MARKTRQIETRMVAEYIKERYANFPSMTAVPLGKVSDADMAKFGYEKAIRMMRPFRPEVDAIVVLPNYLLLIEAKVTKVVDGCAKLPLYKSLVPFTPELKQYQPRELLMQLVVGQTNDNLEIMARDAGVEVQVYNPPWLQEVVDKMNKYWTREYREERERKLELRERFGVE